MKPQLSQRSNNFRQNMSPVKQIMMYADPATFRSLGLNPEDVISFAGGWVNHAAPEGLQRAYIDIVKDAALLHKSGGYSPTLGMPECKAALAAYENYMYGISLHNDNIAIGQSSTQMTYDLMPVLMNPGDKILLLDPSYCNFPTQITTALDVDVLRFPVVDPVSWRYIADEKIEEFVSFVKKERPKVIILVSPDNPTSQVLSDDFVQAAYDAAHDVGSFVIMDFAYKDIVFMDKKPNYFSWAPDDVFLSLHSNSKWCRGLGRRLGWIEAREDIVASLESMQSSTILCPDTLHQMALTRYLHEAIADNSLRSYLSHVSDCYKSAAQHTVQAIHEFVGKPCFVPQGGLYTCINVGTESAAFVKDVLVNAGVLFIPGWGFGRTQQNAVRVSYGPLVHDHVKITTGMKRAGQWLGVA